MRFKGATQPERNTSEDTWNNWVAAVEQDAYMVGFAKRWATTMEEQVAYRQARIVQLATPAFRSAGGDALNADEIRDVVQALVLTWRYGNGLRVWAESHGIIPRG